MKDEEVIEIPCIQFQELNKMMIRLNKGFWTRGEQSNLTKCKFIKEIAIER
jgi:hypothetical protein